MKKIGNIGANIRTLRRGRQKLSAFRAITEVNVPQSGFAQSTADRRVDAEPHGRSGKYRDVPPWSCSRSHLKCTLETSATGAEKQVRRAVTADIQRMMQEIIQVVR